MDRLKYLGKGTGSSLKEEEKEQGGDTSSNETYPPTVTFGKDFPPLSPIASTSSVVSEYSASGSPLNFGSRKSSRNGDSEEYVDVSSDFSTVVGDDVHICLSSLQREVTELALSVKRTQSQLLLANSRYTARLKELEDRLQSQEDGFKRKESHWNGSIKTLFNKVDWLERTLSLGRLNVSSWQGKFVIFFLLVVWPLLSYRIWRILKDRKRPAGNLIGFFFSIMGLIAMWKKKQQQLFKVTDS